MLPNTTISTNSVFIAEIDGCTPDAARPASIARQEPISIFNDAKALPVQMSIYPNPVSDIATISLTTAKIASLTVYTKEGTVIFKDNAVDSSYKLDVSRFEKGIYLLTVTTDSGEILTDKIIKK
jgi:hypothetical protein